MEQLKERYYDMCRALLIARSSGEGASQDFSDHPLAKFKCIRAPLFPAPPHPTQPLASRLTVLNCSTTRSNDHIRPPPAIRVQVLPCPHLTRCPTPPRP